ncbi:MAG: helix-turn-helix domain-containing protein [Kiritimatiellales bacterium]
MPYECVIVGDMKKAARTDTRQRAVTAYLNHQGTQAQIAELCGVDPRTFQRWLFRYRQTGEVAPLPRGHRRAVFDGSALKELDKLVRRNKDATLEELKTLSGASCSIMAVQRALDRLGYRYKKNAPCRRARA